MMIIPKQLIFLKPQELRFKYVTICILGYIPPKNVIFLGFLRYGYAFFLESFII